MICLTPRFELLSIIVGRVVCVGRGRTWSTKSVYVRYWRIRLTSVIAEVKTPFLAKCGDQLSLRAIDVIDSAESSDFANVRNRIVVAVPVMVAHPKRPLLGLFLDDSRRTPTR